MSIILFQFFAGSMMQFLHSIANGMVLMFGIAVCLCYQCLLSSFGLKDYLQHGSAGDGSRSNLIDANREGLISCIGYTGLFLIASHLGSMVFTKR